MNIQEKTILGDILSFPFRTYRKSVGTPKKTDKYTGTLPEKQRVKKILSLILTGKNLEINDRRFMDMFNRHLSENGYQIHDQSNVEMDCDDKENCRPYIFGRGSYYGGSSKKTKDDDDDDENVTPSFFGKFKITTNNEIKPKSARKNFKPGNDYDILILNKPTIINGLYEINFRNSFLNDKDDYLILRTNVKNPFRIFVDYKVYQNNLKQPLKTPTYIGDVSAKIY